MVGRDAGVRNPVHGRDHARILDHTVPGVMFAFVGVADQHEAHRTAGGRGALLDPEVGVVYRGARVVSVLDFGAFVEIMPGKDGLVHVSALSDERVEKPSDIVKEGDLVDVKLVAIDEKGRLQLSMKTKDLEG